MRTVFGFEAREELANQWESCSLVSLFHHVRKTSRLPPEGVARTEVYQQNTMENNLKTSGSLLGLRSVSPLQLGVIGRT